MSASLDITNESLPDGFAAGHGSAGATEQPLADPYPVRKFVVIVADFDNDDPLLIGPKGNSANGFVLKAGETSPRIHLDDLSKVFITGASSNPAYSWMSI